MLGYCSDRGNAFAGLAFGVIGVVHDARGRDAEGRNRLLVNGELLCDVFK